MERVGHVFDRLADSPLKVAGVTVSIAMIGYVLVQGLRKMTDRSNRLPPPPGPPRHFLIGNLLQFPKDHFYKRFCEWQREYGDIVSVEIPGINMVILNSYETAQELLGKRPNSTAGRKIPYMALEVMGNQWSAAFIQPGPHHSNQRKMLRRGIGPQRVGSHTPIIEKNATRLMMALQSFEGDPHKLVLHTVGKVVIEVAYGTKLPGSMSEELSSWNLEIMDLVNAALSNFWLVDIFHFLRFIPSWMPGAEFKRIGDRSTWLSKQIRYAPFKTAKALHKSGEIGHSLATDLLDEFGPNDDVMDALAVLYGAGSDTTSAAVMAFINALLLFPEISKKVYEEIIRATDGTRLPCNSDRANLPYTEAVWKEAFRWNTFIPVGVPHVNSQDEIFNGYLIKAGTLIGQNTGFMLSDPKVWGDPENFRPERFLTDEANSLPNPLVVVFGYGIRVCPGMYLADRTGFHISATIAALYDVVPLEGKSRPKPELVEYTDTFFRLPVGLQCRFVPRDSRTSDLLKAAGLDE
ncbi:hypothetical protein M408DRAFT_329427 [Serendipita vermifera MAFF 305830]|uniref:Cytochrome P450 n=1 Tax=Serendipita vermifera MAFF 305830 TaxID=933852 RepID=A0A0C2WQ43_SERVB|nr:hypothetical protein M408DRAFT_329427 [Serendipita vermifera MAFF 305830]